MLLAGSVGVGALFGCSGDEPEATPATTTTSVRQSVPPCLVAEATVGAEDPPTDLVEVAGAAGRIADLAYFPEEPLASALADVSDGAADLTDAARSGDPAAIADAAATLTAAYDALDEVAADLEAAECSSESWGRQVAIAAIDLVGAGG